MGQQPYPREQIRRGNAVTGVFLLIVMVPLRPWVAQVPVAALVAIMIMVSASTFLELAA